MPSLLSVEVDRPSLVEYLVNHLGWNITRLSGINIPGGDSQFDVTVIAISGFSTSDNGGTIQCINIEDGGVQGMADGGTCVHVILLICN